MGAHKGLAYEGPKGAHKSPVHEGPGAGMPHAEGRKKGYFYMIAGLLKTY